MVKDFQPYCDLWTTVSDWLNWCKSWMDGPLIEIDAEQLEKNVNDSFKTMQKCVRQFKNSPGNYTVWGKGDGACIDTENITACSEQRLRGCHMNVWCILEPAEKLLVRFFLSFFFPGSMMIHI